MEFNAETHESVREKNGPWWMNFALFLYKIEGFRLIWILLLMLVVFFLRDIYVGDRCSEVKPRLVECRKRNTSGLLIAKSAKVDYFVAPRLKSSREVPWICRCDCRWPVRKQNWKTIPLLLCSQCRPLSLTVWCDHPRCCILLLQAKKVLILCPVA